MKQAELVARTGLTTGSFYHHFGSMAAYLEALAGFYGEDRSHELLAQIDSGDVDDPADPVARLRALNQLARNEQMRPLDAAMRDWAGTSPAAAAAVEESDGVLLDFITTQLEAIGLDRDDARVRALMLLALGATRIQAPWPVPADTGDRVLDLLTHQDPTRDQLP